MAGTVSEIFQLGGAGADRRKSDRPGETAQSMCDPRELRNWPCRAERRHLANENADGIALGDERRDEALPGPLQNLLAGVGHAHGFTLCVSPRADVCPIAHHQSILSSTGLQRLAQGGGRPWVATFPPTSRRLQKG